MEKHFVSHNSLRGGFIAPKHTMICEYIKQESSPVTTESALIPDRKESGQLEARKAKVVGVTSQQFRGLAASLLLKVSRVGCDVLRLG